MGAITVRNIEEGLKLALRKQAASNNRSMEEEVRTALRSWVSLKRGDSEGLGTRMRRRYLELGSVPLEVLPRGAEPIRSLMPDDED